MFRNDCRSRHEIVDEEVAYQREQRYSPMNCESRKTLVAFLDELKSGSSRSDEKLVAELRTLPEFAPFDDKPQSIGAASVIASLPNLANWMLQRAANVGCEAAVRDLYRYLTSDRIPFRKIMVLAGAKIEASLRLAGGIELIPFQELPQSTWKTAVVDYFGRSWANYKPSAALQQPFLHPRQQLHQPARTIHNDGQFEELEDVRLCMTAIGPCAPLWLGSWIEAEEWVPNLANMAHLPERLNAGNYPRTVAEDWTGLELLHGHWRALPTKQQRYLRIALSRVNEALRRTELVDSAIDLGIAMDAVFLSGKAADRGEIGLTLRLRAAHFLAKDLASRTEISDLFSALYLLRNTAVHAGAIGPRIKRYDPQELLNEGFRLVAKATRRLINHGEPDWHSIILG